MRGELDLLKIKPPDAEKLKEFFSNSSRELNYLGRILEDLLTLARVEAGAASLVIESVRLDEILIELTAAQKTTQLNLFGENFEVPGDAVLLTSLFKICSIMRLSLQPPEPLWKLSCASNRRGSPFGLKTAGK